MYLMHVVARVMYAYIVCVLNNVFIKSTLQLLDITSCHRHNSWCEQVHSGQGGAIGGALHRQR